MKTVPILCLLLMAPGCAGGKGGEKSVKNAGAEARSVADDSFGEFKVLSGHEVPPGEEAGSVTVSLDEGSCYRFVGVRAGAAENQVEISFKHPEQMLEEGTDVFDLSSDVWEEGGRDAVWGLCAWPSLAGEIQLYHNLSESGGYLLILEEKAKRLTWQHGQDVKLYLAGTGVIDLEMVEKEEAGNRLMEFFAKDRESFPSHLSGKNPFFNDMVGTRNLTWEHSFAVNEDLCYHLFLASVNCATSYVVENAKTGKTIYTDATPEGVGRSVWSHDFCPEKKHFGKEATVHVDLKMETDEYDKCWVSMALYSYELGGKEKKKLKVKTNKARNKVKVLIKQCKSARKSCKKECKQDGDEGCTGRCDNSYEECVTGIVFEGEMG